MHLPLDPPTEKVVVLKHNSPPKSQPVVLNGMLALDAPIETPAEQLPTDGNQLPVEEISEPPPEINESLPMQNFEFAGFAGDFRFSQTPEHQTSTPVNSQPENDSQAPSPLVLVSKS